jgi:hypothetical protein
VSSEGWRILRGGSGHGAVLTIDFTVAKVRGQASFADLARNLPDGLATWGTDQDAWLMVAGELGEQLERWLVDGCAVDTPVRAMLGFCGAAALAPVLAHRIGGDRPPAVVLFDPIVVGPQNMIDQTTDSLRQLAGAAGLATPLEEAVPAPELADLDVGELATSLTRIYATRAAEVGAAKSIRASTVEDLCRRFEGYLRYLALCAAAWSQPRVAPDLIALSRGHDAPPVYADTPVVRVDATQHVLLGHPDAGGAAARVLVGVPVDGRS